MNPEMEQDIYVDPQWSFSPEVMAQYDQRREGEVEEGMDLSSLSFQVYPLTDHDVSEEDSFEFPSVPFVQLLEETAGPIVLNFGSHS